MLVDIDLVIQMAKDHSVAQGGNARVEEAFKLFVKKLEKLKKELESRQLQENS